MQAQAPGSHISGGRVRKVTFDGHDLAVWIGPDYESATPQILVLGESRYDEEFTDRRIIEYRVAGQFRAGQRRTFTNFERAVLGCKCSDDQGRAFWLRSAFCNFNRGFFPGEPRVALDYRIRAHPRNATCLRSVLQELRPTHVIVWGKGNWDSIDAAEPWSRDETIPETREPFCSTTIDGHRVLFTRVRHPSAAFSWQRWAPALSEFLKLSTTGSTPRQSGP